MQNENDLEGGVARLERIIGIQQTTIDRLGTALIAQHGILTGLAGAVGVKFEEEQPAHAPTMN